MTTARSSSPAEVAAPSRHDDHDGHDGHDDHPGHAAWRPAALTDDDPATAGDRAAIAELCLALYTEDPGLGEMTAARVHQTLAALAREPLRGQAVVLEQPDGERLGYALLIPFYSNELGGLSCEVDELYVRPAHRGRGLGSALFAAIAGGAFGRFAAISLITTPDNLRARRLYERLGFRLVGVTLARAL